MACFLGEKSRALSRCLAMTLLVSEEVTGQYISKQEPESACLPAFLGFCGMGLCLVEPLPEGLHLLAAP